jgi:preprotein translocase subunit SecE
MSALGSWRQPISRSRTFLEECWVELKKVHWPTPVETRGATIAVLVGVMLFSLYLGVVDFALSWLIQQVIG